MIRLAGLICTILLVVLYVPASHASPEKFSVVLERDFKLIQRSSVKTISPVLEALQDSGFEGTSEFLTRWQNKELWYRSEDNRFFYVVEEDDDTYVLMDVITGVEAGKAGKQDITQIKPNSGVRRLLGASLAQFRLLSPDPEMRRASLDSIARDPKPEHLPGVRKALAKETDPDLKNRFERFERLLTMQFAETSQERVSAITSFSDSLSLEVRAALNPLLAVTTDVATALPENANIARVIEPGKTYTDDFQGSKKISTPFWGSGRAAELSVQDAYAILVAEGLAPAVVTKDERDQILAANIVNGEVGGYEVGSLDTDESRVRAYAQLVADGLATASPSEEEIRTLVDQHVYYARFAEADPAVTDAVRETLETISTSVRWNTFLDLVLDAVSLASIYFLAAIGLAITFGVMRVINMAHGEFIMMGAYSGYVVQQFITNYTLSIVVAIPVAFLVTFAAGVALERLVIRHLYDRPLETLLATFGVSIALQQLAKNVFGTQARPLTAPEWLDGALVINDVVSISWIRIAIFVLSGVFFLGLWWTLNKTRMGLETRAVVQNPRMAASMGINPDKINMLTFGLGSGIAGIAGVAIGLYAKVTSELGSDYIVQSFMTVVIGGVGSIWGTLAGAGLIGILQKLIESFNPSNTLAAQTYMIIFIIIFIQFRPRGLVALKGRAAEA